MATASGTIGIGVIGGGGDAAEGHIRGYQDDPRAEVVALWDVNEEKGRAQAARLGVPMFCRTLDELLARDDIDAVSICTPDHLHGDHAHAALQAEKHVLCEKPMCTTREDAARLVADVRASGRVFLGGHVYHFRPDYRAMVAAYRDGEIGAAWLAEGDYISNLQSYYGASGRTPWRSDRTAPQDILLGGGCHPLGLMRWALGAEVTQVFCLRQPQVRAPTADRRLLRHGAAVRRRDRRQAHRRRGEPRLRAHRRSPRPVRHGGDAVGREAVPLRPGGARDGGRARLQGRDGRSAAPRARYLPGPLLGRAGRTLPGLYRGEGDAADRRSRRCAGGGRAGRGDRVGAHGAAGGCEQ